MDLLNCIIQYEDGEMSDEETVTFFQELVNNGMAWTLQGHYGRMAMHLIESGHVQSVVEENDDEERLAGTAGTFHTEEE